MARKGPLERIRDKLITFADRSSTEKSREKLLLMAAELQKYIEDKKPRATKSTQITSDRFGGL